MNQTIWLPYDTEKLQLTIEESKIKSILTPTGPKEESNSTEKDIIAKALSNPIGTVRLSELAKGKDSIVVITSDHTRAVPSNISMPLLLEEIRRGNPKARITIIIATGLHRGMTRNEMKERFGEDICANETIINHDASDGETCVDLGILPSGSPCEINKIAVEADLLVAEGFIEPHFFAGYSGGRKSVLPGIASQICININHSAAAIQHPLAATGILDGNPIHMDMIQAARRAKLSFILNVLLNEDKCVIAAYSGDVDKAHRAGCGFLLDRCGVDPQKSDIVITTNGGYPLDQNLYQCPKGLDAALACANEGAVIILAAACRDGIGGENFGRMMLQGAPEFLLNMVLATPPESTISEQWCVQRFADALIKYQIILVTEGIDKKLVEKMNFIYAGTIEDAVKTALEIKGGKTRITVIPDGVGVIVRRT